ncbi:hypothetical protein ACFFMN_08165 [Planobispora siamensis]|uniref:Uncharacterized protein n=1 Tax=Planobispora siamensis TaxID=936338 RepID=A0A8J3WK53_9ACTN|nr:hypothetical protein [Planobispora siamensis]GIH90466.1 hypothetical protein Psi01_10960 [Planobispora siamensis]
MGTFRKLSVIFLTSSAVFLAASAAGAHAESSKQASVGSGILAASPDKDNARLRAAAKEAERAMREAARQWARVNGASQSSGKAKKRR